MGFLRFLYDFVVGDDWRMAAGAVVGLAATAALAAVGQPAWWLLPLGVALLLGYSVWSAARASRTDSRPTG